MLFEDLVRLDDPEPHSAALNMAIDEALLRAVAKPLLRCYRWERPAVSFGYFGKYTEVVSAWPDRELVRRWTGGGIVPHGEDFTYSLIVPRSCPILALSPADSYLAIHEIIARALDVPSLALAAAAGERKSDACFENPVRHDLVAGPHKVAGAAQRRTRHGLLHQGSIQIGSLPAEFPEKLAVALAGTIEPRALTAATVSTAQVLAAQKYSTPEWLHR